MWFPSESTPQNGSFAQFVGHSRWAKYFCSNARSPMERPTRDKSVHSTAKEELRVTCRQPRVAALSRKWILSPQQSPRWHLDFNHLRGLNHTAGQLPGVGCRKAMGHHLLQVWGCYVWEVMHYTDSTLGICHAIIMWRWQAEGFYESPFPYIRWLWPPVCEAPDTVPDRQKTLAATNKTPKLKWPCQTNLYPQSCSKETHILSCNESVPGDPRRALSCLPCRNIE